MHRAFPVSGTGAATVLRLLLLLILSGAVAAPLHAADGLTCLRAVAPLTSSATDLEVRTWYHRTVCTIPALNARWVVEGIPVADRAMCAYHLRHEARLAARRAMSGPVQTVEEWMLELRDLVTYGHCDGPTFEQLVEHQREKGLAPDAAYEAVIRSASRTNPEVDARFGFTQGCQDVPDPSTGGDSR